MIDSIFIGMSGLAGYSKGLRVISNNLTNMNTPGFKGSHLQFVDLFYQNSAGSKQLDNESVAQFGTGLNTLATAIDFKVGQVRQTGNKLDLSIDGEGFFVLKGENQSHYTKNGSFRFGEDGYLVSQSSGLRVMALDDGGKLVEISISDLQTNPPKATSNVKFSGNLSSTATDFTLDEVKIVDSTGAEHTVSVVFKNNSAETADLWSVEISDEAGTLGSGAIQFKDGMPAPDSSKITFSYDRQGISPFSVALDFSNNVTSFASGNFSTLEAGAADGYGSGSLTDVFIDTQGKLIISYSNGQTVNGPRLALARFNSNQDLIQIGNGEFQKKDGMTVHFGNPGSNMFGNLTAQTIEGSNVDMTQEFSDLIVMQRGYQASSHVVSTANEMIQQLFDMKDRR